MVRMHTLESMARVPRSVHRVYVHDLEDLVQVLVEVRLVLEVPRYLVQHPGDSEIGRESKAGTGME